MKKTNSTLAWKKAAAMIAISGSIGVVSAGAIGCKEKLEGMKEAESEVDMSSLQQGYFAGMIDAQSQDTVTEERIDDLLEQLNGNNENKTMKEADMELDEDSYKSGYMAGYHMAILDKSKETGVDYIGIQVNDYDINYAPIKDLTAIYTNEEDSKYYVIENYENEQTIEADKYENLLTGDMISERVEDFSTIDFRTYIDNAYGKNYDDEYTTKNILIINNRVDKKYFEESEKTK